VSEKNISISRSNMSQERIRRLPVPQASRNIEQVQPDGSINEASTDSQSVSRVIPQRIQQFWQRQPRTLIMCLLFCLIALGFNLYRLGAPSIWFDEAFSVELARQPLPLLWHIIFDLEPNMELYYLFLHFWLGSTSLLGLHPTEFVVRLPSAIFAALSTGIVFLWGRRFLNTMASVIGTVLYLLNYLQLIYAQQTRAYSLQLLLTCIAWYALFSALTSTTSHSDKHKAPSQAPNHPLSLRGNASWWWIGYTIATVLAIYTHLFSGLIVLAQLVAVLGIMLVPNRWQAQARSQLKAMLISLGATAILIIPMLLVARQGAKTGWLPIPHRQDLVQLLYILSGYHKIYLILLVACFVLAIAVTIAASTRLRPVLSGLIRSDGEARQQNLPAVTWSLLCWLIIPIVVSYVISHSSLRLFSDRYLVTIVPPLCLLMALGISTLRWRLLRIILALGVLAIALTPVPLYYRSAQVEDWNSATHWVQQQYRDGDGLVCYDNSLQQGCQVSVQYYLDAYPGSAHFTADTPGPFSWQAFDSANPDAAVDPSVLAAFGAKHPRIFFIVGRVRDDAATARAQAAQQWLDSHYHRVGQFEMRTVRVYLYETKAQK
jgi:mannosyltransferase